MMRANDRSIFIASVTVGGLTLLARLVAAVKDLLVARFFGTSSELDAYLIAMLAPSFLISVIGGSFGSALIPIHVEVREREGAAAARSLLSGVMSWSLMILAAASVLLGLSGALILRILGAGFAPATRAISQTFFYALLPIVVLGGIGLLWSSVLNAEHRFVLASIAPAMTPIAMIAALLLFSRHGISALIGGTLVGFCLQVSLLALGLARERFPLLPRLHRRLASVRRVFRQYAPMIAGAFIMGGNELADQAIATTLGAGSVAALSYGTKITAFFLGIGGVGLGTAALPHFSRMVANADWGGVRRTLKTYLWMIIGVSVPITTVLIVFSQPIVRLIYERGVFNAADTLLVSRIQALNALQIPFFLMSILIVRLISSLKANQWLMWGAAINLMVNIGLDLALSRWLGVAGIALASAGVYLISFCYLSLVILCFLNLRNTDRRPAADG